MFLFPVPGRTADTTARVRVKICGITHPADAEDAATLGADALGLNFYPASPRCLDPARDAGWLRALAGVVPRVAVLVNAPREEIDRLLGENLVDAVQLHGDEDAEFCRALSEAGIPFAKALRVRGEESVRAAGTFHTPWIVLDAFDPKAYGGTGQTADWTLAARCVREGEAAGFQVVLSGGLTPVNVAAAVRQVGPAAVDVASGVERPDDRRRKDPARMKAFSPRFAFRRQINCDRNALWRRTTSKLGKILPENAFYREKWLRAGSVPAWTVVHHPPALHRHDSL